MAANAASKDQTEFPGNITPIGVFFVVVPTLAIALALYCMVRLRLPYLLLFLLLAVIGLFGKIIKDAVQEMCEVTVEWSAQGITVKRLIGGSNYSWSNIEKIELFDPGATFGDGRNEEKRAAIGLYVRDPKRKERPHGAPPDVMLLSRSGEEAVRVAKLTERLSNIKRTSGGKDGARKMGGNAGKTGKGFRRNAASAAAAANG